MPESTVQTFSPSPANVQPNEYHVASFVGHAINKHIAELTEEITQIEGAEIHAVSDEGKIVFTIEASSQKKIGFFIDQLKHHIGLLSLSPIYHQFLTEE
jgi:nitrate reductase NapD